MYRGVRHFTCLPARPSICMISRSEYSFNPSSEKHTVFLMMTMWHGRLTPTASVDVQQMTLTCPSRNPFSISWRSDASRPAWWKATPAAKVSGDNVRHGRSDKGGRQPFRSESRAVSLNVGPAHCRSPGLFIPHQFARSLAVPMVDFRVMQKTMIGFFCECLVINSGSLSPSASGATW